MYSSASLGMAKIGRFTRYWWDILVSSKDAFDIISWLGIVIFAGLAAIGHWANLDNTSLKFISSPPIQFISVLVAIGFSVRGVLWLPFRKHEEQQNKSDSEKHALQSELQSLKPQVPILEIGTDPHQGEKSRNGKCRIQVCNTSNGVVAKGVTVKLLHSTLPIHRSVTLQPEEKDGDVIHPQVPAYFDFFTVERTDHGYILRVKLVGYDPQVTFDPKLISRPGEKPPKYQDYNFQIGAYVSQSPSPLTSKSFKLIFSGDLCEPAFTLFEINEAALLTQHSTL